MASRSSKRPTRYPGHPVWLALEGRYSHPKAGSHGSIDEQTREILEQIGLEDQAQIPAQNLSYGDRRKLEIGIVLATDPKLVLLDSPPPG